MVEINSANKEAVYRNSDTEITGFACLVETH